MEGFEFLHLLLEDADVIHEGDDAVGGHGTGVESGGGQERGHVQRHGTLRRVQHEQFAPDEAQQRHLVRHLEIGEEGDVAGPLDGREEEPGGQLANVVDAHDVVARLHALAVARRRVRLGPQQQRNVTRQVAVRAVEAAVVAHAQAAHAAAATQAHVAATTAAADPVRQRQLTRESRMLRRRNSTPLDSWNIKKQHNKVK